MTCALTTSRGAENPHTGHSCQHSASVLGTAAPHAHLTGFRRIFLHQLSPGACSLVPEFGKERVPSGVVDRAGQYSARKSFRSEEHTSELQSRGHLVCRL